MTSTQDSDGASTAAEIAPESSVVTEQVVAGEREASKKATKDSAEAVEADTTDSKENDDDEADSLTKDAPQDVDQEHSDHQDVASNEGQDARDDPASEDEEGDNENDADGKAAEDAGADEQPPLPNEPIPGSQNAAESSASGVAGHQWQAVWDLSHNAYYFWNAATNETTWNNPLVSSDGAGPSSSSAPQAGVPSSNQNAHSINEADASTRDESVSEQDFAQMHGIDPDLAFLDPTLYASLMSRASSSGSSSGAAYRSAGHFDARSGRFVPSSQAAPGGRYDPSRIDESSRAARQMNHMFDYESWAAQRGRAQSASADEPEGDAARGGKGQKRPTKTELEIFRERKKQKKMGKYGWLMS